MFVYDRIRAASSISCLVLRVHEFLFKDYQLSNPNCHFFTQAFADITSGLRSRSSVFPAGGRKEQRVRKEGRKGEEKLGKKDKRVKQGDRD